MSQENVDIVRRVFEAEARRDRATILALYDDEVVWDVSRLQGADFGTGVFHGHDGLRRWFREWYSGWENVQNVVDDATGIGGQVVTVTTQWGRGRESGIEVKLQQHAVWSIRDGKIVGVVWFSTRSEALEAVGQRE